MNSSLLISKKIGICAERAFAVREYLPESSGVVVVKIAPTNVYPI